MENKRKKSIFIIVAKESYNFLNEYLENILYSYDLSNYNIIMPFKYNERDYINISIENNSHNFLIESDEYIKNLENFDSLNSNEIQDLRFLECRRRAHINWLDNKLNYSKQMIKKADLCIIIHNDELNYNVQKELKDEINIARQLNKKIINIEQELMINLNEKIMILKKKQNK